jgi:hypothetical protein
VVFDLTRIRKIQGIHKVKPTVSRDISPIGSVETLSDRVGTFGRFAQDDKLPGSRCR